MKITDHLLNVVTVGLLALLALFGSAPLWGGSTACGANSPGICFATWIGAAGSVASGIGVFVLIYDLRQRIRNDRREISEKSLVAKKAQEAAQAAITSIDRSFGPLARNVFNANETEVISIACSERGINPLLAIENDLRTLRSYSEREGVPSLHDVSTLESCIRQFHAARQKLSWNGDSERKEFQVQVQGLTGEALRLIKLISDKLKG